ncbi:hypothetical protein LD39_10250 [Halobacillus sp. BBL2006]|nr:hypothetical protein LD39_10250 [Halobacillus sp. BBL2006]
MKQLLFCGINQNSSKTKGAATIGLRLLPFIIKLSIVEGSFSRLFHVSVALDRKWRSGKPLAFLRGTWQASKQTQERKGNHLFSTGFQFPIALVKSSKLLYFYKGL